MTDVVKRLRTLRATAPEHSPTDRICEEAAREIELLRAENAELRRPLLSAPCERCGFTKVTVP